MNKMFRIFCATAALLIAMPVFGGGTYYSKVNASVASGSGKVYASAMTSAATPSQITQTTASATFSSGGSSASAKSANHVYYMVARGDAGYALEKWNDGDTSNPRRVVVNATGNKENSPTTASYTATFAPTRLSVESSDYYLGWPVISKSINAEGDRVKLSVAYAIPPASSEFGSFRKSVSVAFEGWYDQEGRLVSDQESFDYTVGPQETLTARFGHDLVLDKDDITGYYRLGTPSYLSAEKGTREFLSIVGSMQYDLNDKTYFNTDIKSVKSMSDPAAIFFVTGTPDRDAIRGKSQRATVVTGIDASAQGVKISHIVKNKALKLINAATAGMYMIVDQGENVSLQKSYGTDIWVTSDKPGNPEYANQGNYDVQPVDEAHVDVNYFGAAPDESMFFEGGYWTSMFTAFPYRCYEPDGVEAYYISEIFTGADDPVAVLTRIDDDVVPAATPVLLKCRGIEPVENRLIPLIEGPAPLDGNMLRGEYQLNESASNPNHVVFDATRMRVFGQSATGIGFYKLADGTELAANKAWLDVSGLTAAQASRIVIGHDLSGVDNVAVDDTDAAPSDNVIYDLSGRRVHNPCPGTIYVRNGRKFIFR